MADITNRADLERLIDAFYNRVFFDEEIGLIVTLAARVSPATHFQQIVDLWAQLLFNPVALPSELIQRHVEKNLTPLLESTYFRRWQTLFCSTVDELFAGPVSERAKALALQIELRPSVPGPLTQTIGINGYFTY
ncbi:group III truncated hemoglobin [Spirosoma sp.]|uniref:group III truncated hemoglobin n=1 Tax=Spirosoma sp. TaxID=1899569 RepID=UPI0026356037|nr:group III truncated hemoglobin [Spirosoma sp.]MCX6218642.1 group III truncated hemoglobin [Spirosoma sp.]